MRSTESRHEHSQRPSLRILFAGRLEEAQKRVTDLVAIAHALAQRGSRFELTIAGDGPDEGRLRSELQKFADRGVVEFLGRVPQGRFEDQILGSQDLLLVTSRWETGPIVAFEAMARGVVVVASRYVGSCAEAAMVDRVNCRLFEIGDVAGAVRCIEELRDAAVRRELAKAASAMISDRYSRRASLDAWHRALLATSELAIDSTRPGVARLAPAAGRLDRVLGRGLGDRVRRWMGREFVHSDPGGEWPHSYGSHLGAESFYREAQELDRRAVS